MQCPRCHYENPPQAKFCSECGGKLALTCSACATELPVEAKYCHQCGQAVRPAGVSPQFASPGSYTPRHLAEKILSSRSALEGERKQLTVLFVDVSGFTALSERLDPEDVHGLMNRALEMMLNEVHRYEGTVNHFLGDGIMALFGAPIAHEDHAQRAVHAALAIRAVLEGYREELRRRRAINFNVRQGINTGLVVVGRIGSDLRMDYTAMGDTTNVAARLQQAAQPGRIVISPATHRLVSAYFHLRPLGELALKGKTDPVRGWEVIGPRVVRTRLEVEAERGLTPFVGRERELTLLFECFEKAKAGEGQVVFITGEPGIGKSRLLLEFRRKIGGQATWLEGRAMSYGRSIAFHPLIDLLKRGFRIDEADNEETIVRKIDAAVLRLGDDLRPTLPYLRYLLSVDPGDPAVIDMDPKLRRGEIFDALRRLAVRAAEVQPQVLVYEDVHWIDQASEESLVFAADSVPTSRILQILTYRTGYQHPFGERSYHTRIVLNNLSTAASTAMTKAILAAEYLPDELNALIARKAEGNPFFVEEVVKSLQEIGAIRQVDNRYQLAKPIEEIFVPDTIQDVITARIDRLDEAPKKTLQLASVIGREFTRRLVDRLAEVKERTEELLAQLKAVELVYEKSLFPELAYMFKHALTHEVAYNSLLVQRRKELHLLIGRAVEELYADRLTEHYEVLAHHFSRAEEWPKAFEYLVKAADKAAKAFATGEAIHLYNQALDTSSRLGDGVEDKTIRAIHEALSNLYFLLSDFSRAHEESGKLLALARRAGDRMSEGAALAAMGFASLWAHEFDRAVAESEGSIEVARAIDAPSVAASGHFTIGAVCAVTGRLDAAHGEFDHVWSVSRSVGDVARQSLALNFMGFIKNWRGDYAEGLRFQQDGLAIAREHRLIFPLLQGLFFQGVTLTGVGDYDRALETMEEGLALARKVGDEVNQYRLLNCLGWLYLECGDLDRSIELNSQGADGARKRGDPETVANPEINLADIYLLKGDLSAAHELLEGVYRLVRNPATSDWMKWRYSTHLFASLGDLWLARGDVAKALEFCNHCLDIATRTNSRKNLVKGWRLKGEIARARRQWDEAERALQQALAIAQTIGNPTQLWRSYFALTELYQDLKKTESAQRSLDAARAAIEGVKATVRHAGLRASLENAPMIRRVYDSSV